MAQTNQALWPGIELSVDRGGEMVHSGIPEADPDWRFVDPNGHGHFRQGNKYPTLRWVALPCSMGHGDECTSEGYYECTICSKVIHPGTRTPEPRWIPGVTTFTLKCVDDDGTTTYVFGETQWAELREAMRATVASTLTPYMTEIASR
jgi:hypothetical protein